MFALGAILILLTCAARALEMQSPFRFIQAITLYLAGRSRICCRNALAITFLMTIFLLVFGFLTFSYGLLLISLLLNFLRASWQLQFLNALLVNFMMLLLCTRVTELRLLAIAYLIAARTRRLVLFFEHGLILILQCFGKRIFFTFIFLRRNLITFLALAEFAFYLILA